MFVTENAVRIQIRRLLGKQFPGGGDHDLDYVGRDG